MSWLVEEVLAVPLLLTLAQVVLASSVVLVLAHGLAWATRKKSAATRHAVWAVALSTVVLLPLALLLPGFTVLRPNAAPPASPPAMSTTVALPAAPVAESSPVPSATSQPFAAQQNSDKPLVARDLTQSTPERFPQVNAQQELRQAALPSRTPEPAQPIEQDWSTILGSTWLVGSAMVAAYWAFVHLSAVRLLARSLPAEPAHFELLAECQEKFGVSYHVDLHAIPLPISPVTSGWFRPTILVPSAFAGWSQSIGAQVLMHELAHIRRRDWLHQTIGQVASALFWFNPLVWSALKRLAGEAERASDDAVLAAGEPGPIYAESLLVVLRSLRADRLAAAAGVTMLRPTGFEQRLRALLDARADRRPARRSWKSACLAVLLVVAAPLTVVRLRPAAANAQATASPTAPQPSPNTGNSPLLTTLGDQRFHDFQEIRTMSLSPDGSRAISQSQEGRVVVWNVATGDALHSFEEPRFYVGQLVTPALLRDNQTAVVPVKDNSLTIIDLQGKRGELRVAGGAGDLLDFDLSPDEQTLAVAWSDGVIRLFDVATGHERAAFPAAPRPVVDIEYSASGQGIYGYAQRAQRIYLWGAESGQLLGEIPVSFDRVSLAPGARCYIGQKAHTSIEVRSLDRDTKEFDFNGQMPRVSADGELLVLPAAELHTLEPTTLQIWSLTTGEQLKTFQTPPKWSHYASYCFLPDRSALLVPHDYNILRFNLATGEVVTPAGHTGSINSVAFTVDGAHLATSSGDGSVRLWGIAQGTQEKLFDSKLARPVEPGDEPRWALAGFCAAGDDVIAAAYDRFGLQLFSVVGRRPLQARGLGSETYEHAGFAYSNHFCAVPLGSDLEVLKLQEDVAVQSTPEHWGRVSQVVASRDGRCVATGSADHTVVLWDVERWTPRATLEGWREGLDTLCFSDDGTCLAAIDSTGSALVWRCDTPALLRRIELGEESRLCAALSNDGKILAAGGPTVRLWNVSDGHELCHTDRLGPAVSLAFSPDGRRLAAGGVDGRALVWDLAKLLQTPRD